MFPSNFLLFLGLALSGSWVSALFKLPGGCPHGRLCGIMLLHTVCIMEGSGQLAGISCPALVLLMVVLHKGTYGMPSSPSSLLVEDGDMATPVLDNYSPRLLTFWFLLELLSCFPSSDGSRSRGDQVCAGCMEVHSWLPKGHF